VYSPGRGCGFFSGVAVARERVACLVGIELEDAGQSPLAAHTQHVEDCDGVVDHLAVLFTGTDIERHDGDAVHLGDLDADAGPMARRFQVSLGDHVDHRGVPGHASQVIGAIFRLLVEELEDGQAGLGSRLRSNGDGSLTSTGVGLAPLNLGGHTFGCHGSVSHNLSVKKPLYTLA
jgi:hypothetical protein